AFRTELLKNVDGLSSQKITRDKAQFDAQVKSQEEEAQRNRIDISKMVTDMKSEAASRQNARADVYQKKSLQEVSKVTYGSLTDSQITERTKQRDALVKELETSKLSQADLVQKHAQLYLMTADLFNATRDARYIDVYANNVALSLPSLEPRLQAEALYQLTKMYDVASAYSTDPRIKTKANGYWEKAQSVAKETGVPLSPRFTNVENNVSMTQSPLFAQGQLGAERAALDAVAPEVTETDKKKLDDFLSEDENTGAASKDMSEKRAAAGSSPDDVMHMTENPLFAERKPVVEGNALATDEERTAKLAEIRDNVEDKSLAKKIAALDERSAKGLSSTEQSNIAHQFSMLAESANSVSDKILLYNKAIDVLNSTKIDSNMGEVIENQLIDALLKKSIAEKEDLFNVQIPDAFSKEESYYRDGANQLLYEQKLKSIVLDEHTEEKLDRLKREIGKVSSPDLQRNLSYQLGNKYLELSTSLLESDSASAKKYADKALSLLKELDSIEAVKTSKRINVLKERIEAVQKDAAARIITQTFREAAAAGKQASRAASEAPKSSVPEATEQNIDNSNPLGAKGRLTGQGQVAPEGTGPSSSGSLLDIMGNDTEPLPKEM
ncbi:hypothetical protein EBR77_04075, partial [bacterium]|nr:hypothetical protein [bacterium]